MASLCRERVGKFKAVSGSGLEKWNGCCLHFEKRSKIMRSGQTAAAVGKWHEEHEKSSKIQHEATKSMMFYQ